MLRANANSPVGGLRTEDPCVRAREVIRYYVRFAAAHPELLRMMVDASNDSDNRMQWLVDTHLKPRYADFVGRGVEGLVELDAALLRDAYYAMAGAGSLVFAVAPECRRLTGLDPALAALIETHAEFVARLLVP